MLGFVDSGIVFAVGHHHGSSGDVENDSAVAAVIVFIAGGELLDELAADSFDGAIERLGCRDDLELVADRCHFDLLGGGGKTVERDFVAVAEGCHEVVQCAVVPVSRIVGNHAGDACAGERCEDGTAIGSIDADAEFDASCLLVEDVLQDVAFGRQRQLLQRVRDAGDLIGIARLVSHLRSPAR